MFIEERHKLIVEALAKRMRLDMDDLQALVQASPATVRRDLDLLEQQGRVTRVHGGAVHPRYLEGEASFSEKSREAVAAKLHIAEAVCGLIGSGATIFVDAGTTCLEVGKRLIARPDLTLFTNSLPLAALAGNGGARVICIGGEIRPVSRAMVGALAMSWLGHVRFDVAVIGASGLSAKEITTTELTEAAIKQMLVQRSACRILAADSTKWGQPRSISFARWDDIQHWVTDDHLPPDAVELVTQRGVSVQCLPAPTP